MPLVSVGVTTEDPAFPLPPTRGWRYTVSGARNFTWLSPRGDTVDLTDGQNGGPGYSVLPGVRGLDGVDPEFTSNEKITGGSVAQHWRPAEREMFLPVRVEDTTRAGFLTRKRTLIRAFNHSWLPGVLRPGVLTVTELDGTARQIEAYRAGPGLEGDESDDGAGPEWAHLGVLLRAPQPYWLDTGTRTVTWAERDPVPFFPIYPLRLAPDRTLGVTSEDNPGDVEAFPSWEITGPCDSVGFDNTTTGRTFLYDDPLAVGEKLFVDCDELHKTVRLADGTNVRRHVSTDSSLWSLAPGANEITLTLANPTIGATSAVMTYRPKYEGA